MCGISVIVNTIALPVDDSLVRRLNARISHRGPDHEGVYHGTHFVLGHRRLSILDTAHIAHQPLKYREHIITFNGEIYNHRQLKEELLKKGYQFSTRSDTEVILAAYDCWGEQCVSHFEGMWSFVIYDIKKNILFGSRDRFGLKPFYYGRFGNYFTIASEIKQFVEIPAFKAVLNQQVAFNFLNYGALNYSDETFFEGVTALGAGHNMTYHLSTHQYSINRWYHFPDNQVARMHIREAAEEFTRLFEESVATRLHSDVKVGACLSGGLDSSSIVCMANRLQPRSANLTTLGVCWQDKSIDEREYIDTVARHTGINSIKIFPEINDLSNTDVLNKIIYYQDQPIPSTSHFSEYKVYEAAGRNGLTVMLDGQGADEYLYGYGIFNWFHTCGLLANRNLVNVAREWNALKRMCSYSDIQVLKTLLYTKYRTGKTQLSPLINETWGREFAKADPLALPQGTRFNARNLSYNQVFISSLPYQLHSADRNSMCHSVESRLPFLDHRLVEFCYALPDSYKISKGVSKMILREGLKDILPASIRERKSKLGFPAPEAQWMKDNASWMMKELDEHADVLGQFVLTAKVKNDFNNAVNSGSSDYAPFFRILSFAKWMKLFNVHTSPAQRVHPVATLSNAKPGPHKNLLRKDQ